MRAVQLEVAGGGLSARSEVALREGDVQAVQCFQRPPSGDEVEVPPLVVALRRRRPCQKVRAVAHMVEASLLESVRPRAGALNTDLLQRDESGPTVRDSCDLARAGPGRSVR